MESQTVIAVHFNITLIFPDGFLDAFNADAMPALIIFTGGQAALWIGKGFFLLEFMTVITINGVLVLLIVLISMKASGVRQAASMALSRYSE